jgi:hypothetical protein
MDFVETVTFEQSVRDHLCGLKRVGLKLSCLCLLSGNDIRDKNKRVLVILDVIRIKSLDRVFVVHRPSSIVHRPFYNRTHIHFQPNSTKQTSQKCHPYHPSKPRTSSHHTHPSSSIPAPAMATPRTIHPSQESDRLFTQLNEQSIILRKSPEQYLEIASELDELSLQISSIKINDNPPRCFAIKSNALTIMLQNHSELLKCHPSRFNEIAASIHLMQLQLGRLTMQDGDDEFAQKMDALASRIEASWMPREGMDGKEIGLMEHLHRIWRELNLSVPGCECGQCQVLDEDRLVWLMGCGSVFLGLTLFWQLGIVDGGMGPGLFSWGVLDSFTGMDG